MKRRFTFLLFTLAFFTANAYCAGLSVISKRPLGQINESLSGAGISVTFNRPAAALSGENQQESSACPLSINPPVEGTCRWVGTQTLTFTPSSPLANATKYTVTLPAGFKSGADGSSLSKKYSWSFETARPSVLSSRPYDGERWLSLRPKILVVFNMELDLNRLHSFAELVQGNISVPIKISRIDEDLFKKEFEYSGYAKGNVYVFEPAVNLEPGKEYKLILKKGLLAKSGNLGMSADKAIRFYTYGDLDLALKPQAECLPYSPALDFTNPVTAGEIAKNITFSPALKYTPCDPNTSGWARTYENDGVVSRVYRVELCGLEFKAGQSYQVTLGKDLKDIFGNRLGRDVTFTWDNKGYCPNISFKGGFGVMESYLPARHPIKAINAGGIEVEKQLIDYKDFITFYKDEAPWCRKRQLKGDFLSNIITPNMERNISVDTFINLAPALNGGKYGFVFTQILNKHYYSDECWQSAFDNITDIGVSLKTSPSNILVWAADLKTGKELRNAEVEIRDLANNVLWTGFTDKRGIASAPGWTELKPVNEDSWRTPRLWVFVKNGEDVAVVSNEFNDGIQPWRFNLNYDFNPANTPLEAFTFTDRGVYRQGEPVYIKSIIRSLKDGVLDYSGLKEVKLRISDSRGKEVLNKQVEVNAETSSLDYEYRLPASSPSGYWNISIENGELHSYASFRVEAVKPAEFEVLLTPLSKLYYGGERAVFSLGARYMFGGALDGAPVDLSFNLTPSAYTPKGWEKYSFYQSNSENSKDLLSSRITLDEKGSKTFDFTMPSVSYSALLYVQAGVLSPQNQKLFARSAVSVLPADVFIGVKSEERMAEAGKPFTFDIVAVDAEGKLLPAAQLQGKIFRKEYMSVRKTGVAGRLEWISEEKTEDISSFSLNASEGKAQYSFTPEKAGSYNLTLTSKDAKGRLNYTDYSFYVTDGEAYWKQTDDDLLSLQLNKDEYKIGSKASLLIKSPYKKAQALITVEREGVLDYYVKTVKGGAAKVSIPVKENYAPNAFISVILVQGRAEEQKYADNGEDLSKPQAKFGYAVLNVPPKEFELKTYVSAERGDYRPGQTVNVNIRTEDYKGRGTPASVTVFAVDESMLALTAYETPDPFSFFYAKRPLAVETADNRLFVIGQRSFGQKGENRGGGGSESKLGGVDLRSNFVFTPFFAASVQTNESGNGEVSFKTPDNLTKFRLMAVSASKDQFGKAQSFIEVSKPLMIKPLLPRFARPGDSFECGFVLYNYTANDGLKAETDIKVSGGVQLVKPQEKTVTVPAGGSVKVAGKCLAGEGDKAVFAFKAASSKDSDGLETSLPLLQVSREENAFTFAVTENEEIQKLAKPFNSLLDGQNKVRALFSSSILLSAQGAANYLKTYPYNCLEQQMSKLLLYTSAKDILLMFKLAGEEEINQKASAIIDDVISYQTSSGGFAYWPHASYADAFVTAYAVDVLENARKNGFNVDGDVLSKASAWLNQYLSKRQKGAYDYDVLENDAASAHAVYALALTGGNAGGYFSNLYARSGELGLEAKIYLFKAAKLLKRKSAFKKLYADIMNYGKISERGLHFEAPSHYRWIYTSNVRVTAMALEALLSQNAPFPQDYQAAAYLNASVGPDGAWGNTLTNAAVIRAFNAYYVKNEAQEPDFKAFLKEGGKNIFEASFKGRKQDFASFEKSFKEFFKNSDAVVLNAGKEGKGKLYYSLGLAYYPKELKEPVSAGFKVEKEIKPFGGNNSLKAGERAEVVITVSTDQARRFVVLQDYLPAGFEIVDESLATEGADIVADDDGAESYYNPFHRREIYDDSIAAFADYMPKGVYKFKYTVTASTSGYFKVPPAWVNAMYAPEVYGRTGSGEYTIK